MELLQTDATWRLIVYRSVFQSLGDQFEFRIQYQEYLLQATTMGYNSVKNRFIDF